MIKETEIEKTIDFVVIIFIMGGISIGGPWAPASLSYVYVKGPSKLSHLKILA